VELTIESAFSPGGLVGNLSYLLLILSMAMRNIFWLRFLAIFSGLTGITYDVVWLHDPVGAFWESLFTLVNLIQWLWLVYEKKRVTLSARQADIRDRVFPVLTNAEFLKLFAIASIQQFRPGQTLVEAGDAVLRLFLITDGQAEVKLGDARISTCCSGDFIGEIGFFNKVPATATVCALDTLECLVFECDDMHRVMQANNNLERGITFAMNANLANKLIRNNATGIGSV